MRPAICILVPLAAVAERPAPPLGLDAFMPVPESNPLTREKVELGRKLFFDTRLSRDGSVACSTCHDPKRAFTDEHRRARGIGGRIGPRRTPRIANRGYGRGFFWDGRATTLEDQVVQPIANPKEMDLAPEEAARRAGISVTDLRQSLASYVRTIVSGDSPYDRYVTGDASALTARQLEGLGLFRGKARCVSCHNGPNLTDERFHATGAGESVDRGRFEVTQRNADMGAFKTPSLRDAARTPPYMHDGSLATLADVIEFYDKGGKQTSRDLRRLGLTEAEKVALVEFIGALNGTIREGW
jgi:cytochrome c peroxidase